MTAKTRLTRSAVLGLVLGGLAIGLTVATTTVWVIDRAAAVIAPKLEAIDEIILVCDDLDALSRMTHRTPHNQIASLYACTAVEHHFKDNTESVQRAVAAGASKTSGAELRTLIMGLDHFVNGFDYSVNGGRGTPQKVTLIDSLAFPPEFVSEWNKCRDYIVDKGGRRVWTILWAAFPALEPSCPGLSNAAKSIYGE